MLTVLLVIHLLITLALIGVVLIQRSEGGGLGIGSSQGMGAFMSGRGTANLLTRSTAVLATLFMVLSLVLALYSRGTNGAGRSIMDGAMPAMPGMPAMPMPPKPATSSATAPVTVPATGPIAPVGKNTSGGSASGTAVPSTAVAPARPSVPTKE